MPDVVNVNLGITTGNSFTVVGAVPTQTLTGLQLNGRNLTDDVIDAALILILNNGAATDAIGPKTYLGTFPLPQCALTGQRARDKQCFRPRAQASLQHAAGTVSGTHAPHS